MATATAEKAWNFEDISDAGERVTHLYPNDCYYAHLSIYNFALKFCKDKVVLDAGSGSGYGSAYLSERGARFVHAIDVGNKAVAFSQHYFKRPNLKYEVMDLQNIYGFSSQYFDLIFSSNALEHVPDVPLFFRHAWKLLKPEGTMVIAVPPIINEESRKWNEANPYHLNIWSPRQWYHVLRQFFSDIECYRHHFDKPGIVLDFANTPEQTTITEEDFLFLPISLEQLCKIGCITAIFVAHKPLPKSKIPSKEASIHFVDDSFTRLPSSLSISFYHLLRKGWDFGRSYGIIALIRKTYNFLLKRMKKCI